MGYKLETQVSLAILAMLEYVASDVLKLVFNYVKNMRHVKITQQDLRVALSADTVNYFSINSNSVSYYFCLGIEIDKC